MALEYKAFEIFNELTDMINKRMAVSPSLVLTSGSDSDGYPTAAYMPSADAGTPVAGHKNVFFKILAQPWVVMKNAIGLAQDVYTPTLIQVVTEASASAGLGTILGFADAIPFFGEIMSRGTRVEWYQTTNGTAPSVSGITAGNLKYTWDPNFYRPLVNQQ